MILRKALIVVAIAAGAVVLGGCKNQAETTGASSGGQSTAAAEAEANAVITWDGTSFSPSELTVKAGDTIAVKNASTTASVQVNSDPHPTHTLFPGLNVGVVQAGSSKSFKISKAGTYTYHNHLNASQKGKIVAE